MQRHDSRCHDFDLWPIAAASLPSGDDAMLGPEALPVRRRWMPGVFGRVLGSAGRDIAHRRTA